MSTTAVKTRFAPSPTGLMHLGNVRTALFNALYARFHQGTFLLRIEDTDLERSSTEFVQQLMQDLRWLGLDWQEGPDENNATPVSYYQSQRSDIYANYYAQLEQQAAVYPCFCSPQELALSRKLQRAAGQPPRYAGNCAHLNETERAAKLAKGIQPTLRFRIERDQMIEFTDLVRGLQQFSSNDIGDFIIRRADGTPAFFFCNAIDDALMGVTHVLRGEDHLTNTPRQQLILQALQLPIPQYGHISMILGHDNAPLSKRNGSLSIHELNQQGWLVEGIINYLARLGHSYVEDGYLSFAELAQHFSLERLGKAPAHFDEQQLKHWQQAAINRCPEEELWQWMGAEVHQLVPTVLKTEFVTAIRANILYPKEALQWATILFQAELVIEAEAQLVIEQAGSDFFDYALDALIATQADYALLIKQLKQTSAKKGKALFMPLRAALTGQTHGPEMANLLPLLGIDKAKQRLMRWTTAQ